MKITKEKLTKIIKEELEAVMNEEEKLINRGNFKGFDKKTAGKLELLFKLSEVLQKAAKTSRVALPTKPNQYQEKSEEDFAAYKAMIDIFDKESLENTIEQIKTLDGLMRNAGKAYLSKMPRFNSEQNLNNAEET